jgi:hypothetical protein
MRNVSSIAQIRYSPLATRASLPSPFTIQERAIKMKRIIEYLIQMFLPEYALYKKRAKAKRRAKRAERKAPEVKL